MGRCDRFNQVVPSPYLIFNLDEAVLWWRNAVEQGLTEAHLNLAWIYDHGRGVAKNTIIAYMLYNLVAAAGEAHCVENRDLLAKYC